MREFAKAAVLAAAIMLGALSPAFSQATNAPPPVINRGVPITPLGGYVIGSIARAAVSPMIATVILGRGLTISEAYHTTLGCMLGPVGWLLADAMFPPTVAVTNTRQPTPPRKPKRTTSGGNVNIPPSGETRFIANEILLRFAAGTSERSRSLVVGQLNLTLLESQTFELTGQTIGRYRIDGGQSAVQTLRLIARDFPGVNAAQVNFVYVGAQVQQPARQDPPAGDASAQYVVRKLHLLEAHRVNKGDDVLVAVVDSKIDNDHPGLAGVIGGEFDAVGTPTFAGPADPMLREMLARAGARGIVLVAVVGNAGPNSPPLYPGADARRDRRDGNRCERKVDAAGQSRPPGCGGGPRGRNSRRCTRWQISGNVRHVGCGRPCQRGCGAAAGDETETHSGASARQSGALDPSHSRDAQ
jgi:hypothetical protein